jgi:hypothetical protein
MDKLRVGTLQKRTMPPHCCVKHTKIYERILEKNDKGNQGKLAELYKFRTGRATTDLIFGIRQLTEKIGNMEKSSLWYSQTIRKHLIV